MYKGTYSLHVETVTMYTVQHVQRGMHSLHVETVTMYTVQYVQWERTVGMHSVINS